MVRDKFKWSALTNGEKTRKRIYLHVHILSSPNGLMALLSILIMGLSVSQQCTSPTTSSSATPRPPPCFCPSRSYQSHISLDKREHIATTSSLPASILLSCSPTTRSYTNYMSSLDKREHRYHIVTTNPASGSLVLHACASRRLPITFQVSINKRTAHTTSS